MPTFIFFMMMNALHSYKNLYLAVHHAGIPASRTLTRRLRFAFRRPQHASAHDFLHRRELEHVRLMPERAIEHPSEPPPFYPCDRHINGFVIHVRPRRQPGTGSLPALRPPGRHGGNTARWTRQNLRSPPRSDSTYWQCGYGEGPVVSGIATQLPPVINCQSTLLRKASHMPPWQPARPTPF